MWKDAVDGMFSQLRAKAVIHNPENMEQAVTLVPEGQVLWSGSVGTTSVNNMANTVIFYNITNNLHPGMTMAEAAAAIRRSAEEVGFILKVEVCDTPHKLQFLKHSPAYTIDGELTHYLNLGVWFRNFGRCKFDLPGRSTTPFKNRAALYNSEIIRSRVHAGDHILHDAFLGMVRTRDKEFERFVAKEHQLSITEGVSSSKGRIPVSELALRYGVATEAIEHLCELIRGAECGMMISHPVVRACMLLDYGYE